MAIALLILAMLDGVDLLPWLADCQVPSQQTMILFFGGRGGAVKPELAGLKPVWACMLQNRGSLDKRRLEEMEEHLPEARTFSSLYTTSTPFSRDFAQLLVQPATVDSLPSVFMLQQLSRRQRGVNDQRVRISHGQNGPGAAVFTMIWSTLSGPSCFLSETGVFS